MAILVTTCPHCLTKTIALQVTSLNEMSQPHQKSIYLRCPKCLMPSCGVVEGIQNILASPQTGDLQDMGWRLRQLWPTVAPSQAPDATPANIQSFYLQGRDSQKSQHFDAAGTMFRKCLDTALKKLHPTGTGNLKKRIDNLPSDIGVTPAMKDWAHQIRELGNDAAHEEEPFTDADVAALQSFTEVFLTYAFTLPAMVEARKPKP